MCCTLKNRCWQNKKGSVTCADTKAGAVPTLQKFEHCQGFTWGGGRWGGGLPQFIWRCGRAPIHISLLFFLSCVILVSCSLSLQTKFWIVYSSFSCCYSWILLIVPINFKNVLHFTSQISEIESKTGSGYKRCGVWVPFTLFPIFKKTLNP